jgi:hypothetical protein
MDARTELKLQWEWEPGTDVRAAEHRATWARLEMWIGSECVTLVEDRESQSSRRSIYGPLYPLAEWIAFNWWFLRADARPTAEPTQVGTSLELAASHLYERRHLDRHNIQSAGDGFLWPHMMIVPEGGSTRLVWRRDENAVPGRPIRFLSQGEALLDSQHVEQALATFIEAVLTRLAEQGVADTALEKEWSALGQLDHDEEEFCLAAARLGLDPFSEASEFEAEILRAAQELRGHILGDFLDAVSPQRIGAGLDWISGADRLIRRSADETSATVSRLRKKRRGRRQAAEIRPWEVGWRQATEVRASLGTPLGDIFAIEELVRSRVRTIDDRGLRAVGGAPNGAKPVVALGRQQPRKTARFTLARALWHVLYEDEPLFLVTSAYTNRQKIERAFAAELLAPAKGIQERLGGPPRAVLSEELEQIAEHFRVSTMVVEHQLENQLATSIIS